MLAMQLEKGRDVAVSTTSRSLLHASPELSCFLFFHLARKKKKASSRYCTFRLVSSKFFSLYPQVMGCPPKDTKSKKSQLEKRERKGRERYKYLFRVARHCHTFPRPSQRQTRRLYSGSRSRTATMAGLMQMPNGQMIVRLRYPSPISRAASLQGAPLGHLNRFSPSLSSPAGDLTSPSASAAFSVHFPRPSPGHPPTSHRSNSNRKSCC